MALKLVVRSKLRVPVKGTIVDEDGNKVPFSFVLLCDRKKQSEIQAVLDDKEALVLDFVRDVTKGWEDVLDAENQPMEFNAKSFDEAMEQAGLPTICFQAYLKEVGAVAKN
jgi:hypothetical protein